VKALLRLRNAGASVRPVVRAETLATVFWSMKRVAGRAFFDLFEGAHVHAVQLFGL